MMKEQPMAFPGNAFCFLGRGLIHKRDRQGLLWSCGRKAALWLPWFLLLSALIGNGKEEVK